MRRILSLCLALVLLAGCTTAPAGTTEPTTVPTEPTAAPATVPTTEPAPTEDPADSIRTGYYLLTGIAEGEDAIDGLAMAAFRGYLQINPDRTGLLSMNGVIEHVDWTQRYLTINGSTCKFTIEDDVMTLNYKYQWEGTFTYCGNEIPEYYLNAPLEPGMYVLTDLVDGNEVYHIDDPDMTGSYFHLREDNTGVYYTGEEELDLYWKNDTMIVSSSPLTYQFFPADQTDDGIATLILYNFGWDLVIYRAIDTGSSNDF